LSKITERTFLSYLIIVNDLICFSLYMKYSTIIHHIQRVQDLRDVTLQSLTKHFLILDYAPELRSHC